ncbi:MAG: type II toxin-antitoxin system HigB family toxin [Rikenellaceae bacterium]
MRIITRNALIEFYTKHSSSKTALEEWYSKVKKAKWSSFVDIKRDFNSVDYIGEQRYVFNIKGNDYRLVVVVKFTMQSIYIRFIGTHQEYDKINCKNI